MLAGVCRCWQLFAGLCRSLHSGSACQSFAGLAGVCSVSQCFAGLCRCWQLIAALCRCWQRIAALCRCWQVLAGVGRCWQVLAGLCSFPPKCVVPATTDAKRNAGSGECFAVIDTSKHFKTCKVLLNYKTLQNASRTSHHFKTPQSASKTAHALRTLPITSRAFEQLRSPEALRVTSRVLQDFQSFQSFQNFR